MFETVVLLYPISGDSHSMTGQGSLWSCGSFRGLQHLTENDANACSTDVFGPLETIVSRTDAKSGFDLLNVPRSRSSVTLESAEPA